jgi:hypothetical protein
MNQNIRTTDAVTFATVDTGQGATEVHLMNQNIRTTDSVTHSNITSTGRFLGGFGAVTTGGTADWNDISNTYPGSGYTLLLGNATNGPNSAVGLTNYFHAFNFEYSSKDGTGNVTQLGIAYGTPGNELVMRGRYSGGWSTWVRFLTNSNSPYAYNMNQYVRTTDSPTFANATIAGHYYSSNNGSNILLRTQNNADAGLLLQNSSGGFRFQLYGDGSNYGFLNAAWASWDFRKNNAGNLFLNNQSTWYIGTSEVYMNRVYGVTDVRAGIFYDNDDTNFFLNPATSATSLRIAGGIKQNNLVGRPYAVWGASGSTTGAVVIKFPGGTGNYGMIHAHIDIYEYSGNHCATVIVGGHNWNGQWYNIGANVIGQTDKPVRVGVKDGKYCIVIGNGSSSWSYGQVVLRKIQNGSYYSGVMDVAEGYTAAIESDSYSYISGDLRDLRTPSAFTAGTAVYSPIYYDSNNTAYRADFTDSGNSIVAAGSYNVQNYNKPGLLLNASGTGPAGAAFGMQQVTGEGWTGIFVDYEPYTGWGLYHDNPSNYFLITSEGSTGAVGAAFTVPSRVSGNRTSYVKHRFDQNNGNMTIGGIGTAQDSWRAPNIYSDYFYDQGGTFIFRVGSGTGTTRHINLANSTTDPSAVGSSTGISSGARSDNNPYYLMYVKSPYNNGYSTYTRLSLGWHTGLELGGNPSYGGTTIMADSPGISTSVLMSIGRGDSNVRITNNLYVPFIYDSNNAGYYIDMDSTSRMYQINYNNLYYAPDTSYGFIGTNVYADTINSGYNSDQLELCYYRGTFTSTAGSMRAPIFYDRDDTTYYTDLNGGSYVRGIFNVAGGHGNTSIKLIARGSEMGTGQESGLQMWVSEPGNTWNAGGFGYNVDNNLNSGTNQYYWGRPNTNYGQSYFRFETDGNMYVYNTNTGGTRYTNMRFDPGYYVYVYNYLEAGNSLRAPIFYDSNNTGYYSNQASYSNFNEMNFAGRMWYQNYMVSRNEGGMMGSYNVTGTASKVIWTIGESWPLGNMYGLGYEYAGSSFLPGDPHVVALRNNGTTYTRLQMNGGIYTTGAIYTTSGMYAPGFYDSNDTGYYADPNGTSSLARFTNRTHAAMNRGHHWITPRFDYTGDTNYWTGTFGWGTSAGNWDNAWKAGFSGWDIWGGGTGHPQGGGYIHAQGIVSGQHYATSDGGAAYGWMMVGAGDATANRYWARGKWGGGISGWKEFAMYGGGGSGDLRANVFYDSDDTGYYADFNSTSNACVRQRGGTLHGPNTSWGAYLYVGSNGRPDGNASVVATNGNLHLDCQNGYETYINHYSGNRTYTYELRSTFIYDYNNTGYYWNGDGTSRLLTIDVNNAYLGWFEPWGVGGNSGNGTHAYRLFQEGGGWSYPYPDFRLAYHVGIKFGANPSYEGMRFYTDYDMSGIVWQFNGGSNYSYQHTWNQLTGYHGHYSGLNSAHIYPNNGSYGSWKIDGSRNGWAGIEFNAIGAGNVSLMMNSSETGMHNNSYGWHYLRSNGTGYIMKGYWGGSTQATILDSSNQGNAWALNQNVATYTEPRFRSNYFYHGTTSRYTGQALYGSYTMGVWEVRTDFEGISGGESGGIGINGDFMQFWATGDVFQSFMFSDEDGGTGTYIAYLGSNGVFYNSDRRIKYSIREKVSENYEYIDRFMQLKPVTFAYKFELKDDDTPKQRERKISKMLTVHQGLIAQDVMEVFPEAIHRGSDTRPMQFELSEITEPIMQEVGITGFDEVEAVKQKYVEKHAAMDVPDTLSLNWNVINTYQILALQDFKKMYDAKCEEIEELKSELATIKAHLGLS